MQYKIEVFCDNDLNANTYLIYNETSCFIIDPANSVNTLSKYIADKTVLGIFLTHGHYDHFSEEDIIKVRKECRCNDGKSIAAKLLKYLHQADSLQQFVDDFNANETFASLEYLSECKLRFCYPQCYCACIKRVPGNVPKAWCYCTLGNIESIFKQVFPQHNPRATLIESIKTGGTRCIIEIEW